VNNGFYYYNINLFYFFSLANVIIPLKISPAPKSPYTERRSSSMAAERMHAVRGSERERVYPMPRVILDRPFVKRIKGSMVLKKERIRTHRNPFGWNIHEISLINNHGRAISPLSIEISVTVSSGSRLPEIRSPTPSKA